MYVEELTPDTLCDLCRVVIAEATLDGEPRCLACVELELERTELVAAFPAARKTLASLADVARGR